MLADDGAGIDAERRSGTSGCAPKGLKFPWLETKQQRSTLLLVGREGRATALALSSSRRHPFHDIMKPKETGMSRRRGAGEGTISRRADGRWVGAVQVGTNENGRRIRQWVYGRTRGEVVAKVDERRRVVAQGAWADPGSIQVGEYLEAWLRDSAMPRVRASTLAYYRRVLQPVRATLGGLKLRNLSPMNVQAVLRQLEERKVSPRARQMTYTVLKTTMRDAVRMRLIAANPMDAVSRPRAPRPEIRHLDAGQVRQLLEAARGDRFEALYPLAVGTGLRLGELLGLRWGDLDLESGAVQVRRASVEDRKTGAVTFEEPKTARSRRKVDLPGFAVSALARHRERLGAVPHPERLVFTASDGSPVRRSNLHRRSWKPVLKRAGLPDIPFHALRHTAATLALAAGVNPKVVQERLGHSSITLTLDTYSHSVPTLGRDAAARVHALVGGA